MPATPASSSARRSRTWASTHPRSCRTACRCTAAWASPGTTTCTCTCAASLSTPPPTAPSAITACAWPPWPGWRRPGKEGGDMGLEDVPTATELEDYRTRARAWLADNMPALDPLASPQDQSKEALRDLMRRLWDGAYSGICSPTELGGQVLSRYHHRAFCEEAAGYELPIFVGNPGLSIIAPPIMEFGTDKQKQHITGMLKGDEIFVQMMSEPSGGSDMAGALTRADRDGDIWRLNGSKIWSSGAYRADWGLILVRTDWSVPKHRGLSLFLLDLSLPGVTVNKIKMVSGSEEFCQEYFDNVPVPHDCLLGQPNDGWTVASRLLFHERDAVGGGSPYAFNRPASARMGGGAAARAELARRAGTSADARVRELVGEARANDLVSRQLIERVT